MDQSAGTALRIAPHPRRRVQPRHALRSLVYIRFNEHNGGVVRDLTTCGMAIQAVMPLNPGDELIMRFDLLSPRLRVEAYGRVVWADKNGQAGISFVALPVRMQRSIRDWVFVQMLAASAASGRDSFFAPAPEHLVLSPPVLPAIVVDHAALPQMSPISWGFFSFSPRTFSLLVDGMVLLCAILLFSISSIAVMGSLPPLPLIATLLLAAGTIFIAAYHLIFSDFLCGATPGKRLAALAVKLPDAPAVTRFR